MPTRIELVGLRGGLLCQRLNPCRVIADDLEAALENNLRRPPRGSALQLRAKRVIAWLMAKDYVAGLRQRGARTEGAADRDRTVDRAASEGRRRLPNYARKPDFTGFTGGRTFRAFESRGKAATHRVRLFELAAQGKKA